MNLDRNNKEWNDNEKLHDFHISPDVIKAIKSRRMSSAGHVHSTHGEEGNITF